MNLTDILNNRGVQQKMTGITASLVLTMPFMISCILNMSYLNEKIKEKVQLKNVKKSEELLKSALSFNTMFLVFSVLTAFLYVAHKMNFVPENQYLKTLLLGGIVLSVIMCIIAFGLTMNVLLKDIDTRALKEVSKTTQASYVMNIVSFVYLMVYTFYQSYAASCNKKFGGRVPMDSIFE